ncbi:MarR family winged helix-turn-helix transcriptional regulator [Alkaliphilus oremlandii]|uniref:Transcriptional regulator, MarR family n=1 Tax=Alkaliphilus oremlandii (strain OhILAs) TaxID=350688 RepID=A8MJL3_ALKOO|nr:winged helix DNA-binding protein [Alkaliphilus oremlandii]ABW19995.1 transcriptional regulator, MarR family [Alkaliphilus oremlandii OhILAs]
MRNYYIQIHEYLAKLVHGIIALDKKGISSNGFNLSISDILTLKVIGEEQNQKMFEVMEVLKLDRNSFKTIINRLMANDYVVKNKCENDKRAYTLELTEKGYKIFEEILAQEKEMLFSILNDFTFNEERAVLKFLVKLDMLNREKSR